MKARGYSVTEQDEQTIIDAAKLMTKPYYRAANEDVLRMLLEKDLAVKFPAKRYAQWLTYLPASVQNAIKETWGDSGNSYLSLREDDETFFVIPRMQIDNIVVMPQPLRGDHRDREKDIFHDKKIPVHHAYRAAYRYLLEDFKAGYSYNMM